MKTPEWFVSINTFIFFLFCFSVFKKWLKSEIFSYFEHQTVTHSLRFGIIGCWLFCFVLFVVVGVIAVYAHCHFVESILVGLFLSIFLVMFSGNLSSLMGWYRNYFVCFCLASDGNSFNPIRRRCFAIHRRRHRCFAIRRRHRRFASHCYRRRWYHLVAKSNLHWDQNLVNSLLYLIEINNSAWIKTHHLANQHRRMEVHHWF